MGQKDIVEKILEAHEDVFADIMNVLLFHGQKVVWKEDLQEIGTRSFYKKGDQVLELERDVAKRWMNQKVRIACIGIENQTTIDKDMPFRVIGYDGAEYRAQLKEKERYPVITLVLYFGHEKHWDKPKNLLGCVEVPEELRPYVNDYQMNLFEIAYLSDELIERFESDFGIVADYFVQMQRNGNYVPSTKQIQHVEEVLQLLSVMTGDTRFEESYIASEKKEGRTMCEFLDRIENRGIERGRREGRLEGRLEGRGDILLVMKELISAGRMEDMKKATSDSAYLEQLIAEFGIG